MRAVADLLDLVFPRRCAGCDREPPGRGPFCAACEVALAEVRSPRCTICGEPFGRAGSDHPCGRCTRAAPPFRLARAPYLYGGPLADAIRRMKYAGRPEIAASVAPLLFQEAEALVADVILPVPLSLRRLWSRGYNQSALLASRLARTVGRPLDTDSLRRVRDGPPQAGRARTARVEAVRKSFAVPRRRVNRIAGRRVLLVDDVLTTGATASAASRALLHAGASEVLVLTLARAGEPS